MRPGVSTRCREPGRRLDCPGDNHPLAPGSGLVPAGGEKIRPPEQDPIRTLDRPRLSDCCGPGRKVARRKRRPPTRSPPSDVADARKAATRQPGCPIGGSWPLGLRAPCVFVGRGRDLGLRPAGSARRSAQAPWMRLCSGSSARTRVGFSRVRAEDPERSPACRRATRCRWNRLRVDGRRSPPGPWPARARWPVQPRPTVCIDTAAPAPENTRLSVRGGVPKRPTGADCKSAGLCLRRFESFPLHQCESRGEAWGHATGRRWNRQELRV